MRLRREEISMVERRHISEAKGKRERSVHGRGRGGRGALAGEGDVGEGGGAFQDEGSSGWRVCVMQQHAARDQQAGSEALPGA